MKQKIGILGGAFNPIHNGHLFLAENCIEMFNLDKMIFVPCGNITPWKKLNLRYNQHRFNMLIEAIENNHKLEIDSIEFRRLPEISYAIDILDYFKTKYSENNIEDEIYYFIGSDNAINFHTWKNYKDILKNFNIVAISRPGFDYNNSNIPEEITKIELPNLNISSTMIRNRIKNKQIIKYLVPKKVEKYIKDRKLYLK